MKKDEYESWLNNEILHYEKEMNEAERLHLWHLREKYWAYVRIYKRCLRIYLSNKLKNEPIKT